MSRRLDEKALRRAMFHVYHHAGRHKYEWAFSMAAGELFELAITEYLWEPEDNAHIAQFSPRPVLGDPGDDPGDER